MTILGETVDSDRLFRNLLLMFMLVAILVIKTYISIYESIDFNIEYILPSPGGKHYPV